jgi:hypothetical protein
VAEGKLPRSAVDRAEAVWQSQLRVGLRLPNGELVRVTLDDLYHVMVDPRIWRKPERIAQAVQSVFEIRSAPGGRRLSLSRWPEADGERIAALIIDRHGALRMLHLIDERRLRRYIRRGGDVSWRR